jgi:hypothetical protein
MATSQLLQARLPIFLPSMATSQLLQARLTHPKKSQVLKAILLQILLWTGNGPRKMVLLADLIWLALFFLLPPEEYV